MVAHWWGGRAGGLNSLPAREQKRASPARRRGQEGANHYLRAKGLGGVQYGGASWHVEAGSFSFDSLMQVKLIHFLDGQILLIIK
jgi:hypothetical protein